jgi:hypothetical protein
MSRLFPETDCCALPCIESHFDLGSLNTERRRRQQICYRKGLPARLVGHRIITFHISPRPGPYVCRIDAHEWVLSWLYYLVVVLLVHPVVF